MGQEPAGKSLPLRIFTSYAHEDRAFLDELRKHLPILRWDGLVEVWDDTQVAAGKFWSDSIREHLALADIILILVSPDYFASEYANEQIEHALELYNSKGTTIIPIIIRATEWASTPLGNFNALPRNGRSIVSRRERGEVWYEVVSEIRRVCEEILANRQPISFALPRSSSRRPVTMDSTHYFAFLSIHDFNEVFVKSGFPHATFVEHSAFKKLKHALMTPGRGVVIEGPSGIGKTTAVKKVIEDIGSGKMLYLSARSEQDLQQIRTLEKWHQGTVVIDDFHRLDTEIRQHVVDYLKYLADTEPDMKKIVVVGIPHTHQKLVDLSFDLATRIDVFNLTRVNDKTVERMIEKGERELNILFDRKSEIVRAANGSLNIAQYLCWNICAAAVENISENILEIERKIQIVRCNVEEAIFEVLNELSTKFGKTLRYFADVSAGCILSR